MPIDVSGLTQSCASGGPKGNPLPTVLTHLPAGFARTLRYNDAAAITHLAARCLPALYAKFCEPTARAVAARYKVNKDTAAKALRSLEFSGLLLRWRKSVGRGLWVHFALVTDDPYIWLADAGVAATMRRVETETLDRMRQQARIEPDEMLPTVPPAAPPVEVVDGGSPQPVSCPDPSDVPIKDSSKKNPFTEPVDNLAVDRYTARLARLLDGDPGLQPHMPDALTLLHGLGFAPLERVTYGVVLATAMRRGRTLGGLMGYLTGGMGGVRDRAGIMRWRLERLKSTLEAGKSPG